MIVKNVDRGGIKGIVNEVKLMTIVDWDTVFSGITNQETIICTYGDPDNKYNPCFKNHLSHMDNVMLVLGAGTSFYTKKSYREKIYALNPKVKLYIKEHTHAKLVLIAPDEVYVSSQNIGISDWFQVTVYIKDKEVYEQYKKNIIQYVIDEKMIRLYKKKKAPFPSVNTWEQLKGLKPTVPATPKIVRNVECKASHMYNWNQKFNNIRYRDFIISTYSLPNDDYLVRMINKLVRYDNTVTLVVNSKFENAANNLLERLDDTYFTIELRPDLHAKMVLCNNNSVWLGSHNFGDSTWFEETIQFIRNKDVHDFYYNEFMRYMNKDGKPFSGYMKR